MIDLTFTIQSNTDQGNTQLINDYQSYAEEVLGWTAQIPDPNFVPTDETPDAPLIDNPVGFIDKILEVRIHNEIIDWSKAKACIDANTTAMQDVADRYANITLTATPQ